MNSSFITITKTELISLLFKRVFLNIQMNKRTILFNGQNTHLIGNVRYEQNPFAVISYMNEQIMMSFVPRTVPFIHAINASNAYTHTF